MTDGLQGRSTVEIQILDFPLIPMAMVTWPGRLHHWSAMLKRGKNKEKKEERGGGGGQAPHKVETNMTAVKK